MKFLVFFSLVMLKSSLPLDELFWERKKKLLPIIRIFILLGLIHRGRVLNMLFLIDRLFVCLISNPLGSVVVLTRFWHIYVTFIRNNAIVAQTGAPFINSANPHQTSARKKYAEKLRQLCLSIKKGVLWGSIWCSNIYFE